MGTLAEIESAAARLSPAEQDLLLSHLGVMVRQRRAPKLSDEQRQKWLQELDELCASASTGRLTMTAEQIVDELREERI